MSRVLGQSLTFTDPIAPHATWLICVRHDSYVSDMTHMCETRDMTPICELRWSVSCEVRCVAFGWVMALVTEWFMSHVACLRSVAIALQDCNFSHLLATASDLTRAHTHTCTCTHTGDQEINLHFQHQIAEKSQTRAIGDALLAARKYVSLYIVSVTLHCVCHSTLCLSLYIELCVTCEWVVSRINASRSQMNETNSHMDALLVTLFLLPASMCPSRLSYCSHMNESFHSWMRHSHTWVCQSHTWMHYWWRSSCGPQVCVTLDWVFRHIEMSRVTH